MKYNMDEWLQEQLKEGEKKALPILSFPGTQLIGKNVEELVSDGHLQALCMKAIADRFPTGDFITAASGISCMGLSSTDKKERTVSTSTVLKYPVLDSA